MISRLARNNMQKRIKSYSESFSLPAQIVAV